MHWQFIRHATQTMTYGSKRLLVDPMFATPGELPSLTLGPSFARNPKIPLPVPIADLIRADAVLLTHTHFDHWDRAAQAQLPRSLPVFCQPADARKLKAQGFSNAQSVPADGWLTWEGLEVRSFPAQHGTGWVGRLMGPSSGFCLKAPSEPKLLISGDTIWCAALEQACRDFQPAVAVLYSGEARFNLGSPITLDAAGVGRVAQCLPDAALIAVHLESINHCRLTRAALRESARQQGYSKRLALPQPGESLAFS